MYRVKVRFDKADEAKALVVEGWANNIPVVGKDFSIFLFKEDHRIFIDLGKVFNIKYHGDIIIVQTDLIVAEVWINRNKEGSFAEVIPLYRRHKLKEREATC